MKNLKVFVFISFLVITLSACSSDDSVEEKDPIAGKWFLKKVNITDVSTIECYKDSYIDSNGEKITFFIQDRLENGNCKSVLNNTSNLRNEGGFYYIGDEALEFYINGNELKWRLNTETTLIFNK